jgi:hypothetical protein
MRQLAPIIVAISLATAATAQEDDGDGFSLMDEGARMFFEGLMSEMQPALDELRGMAEEIEPRFREMATEMGPALVALLDKVDDFRNYEAPEFLDNGDILIRRKPDAPPYVPDLPEAAPDDLPDAETGEIDL